MTDADIGADLKRSLRRLSYATGGLYLVVIVAIVLVWLDLTRQREDLKQTAESNRAALCSLRGDLERRVQSARAFLDDNPKGIPGISAATIKMGITNQQRTIDALAGLECSEMKGVS